MKATSEIAVLPDGRRVRLSPGAHTSPREGVCVVEMASLIAGEEFGDRPRCVCPVIGAFLRGLNDRAPHGERQRLMPYASRIVGSRGDRKVTRRRRDMCLNWAGADLHGGAVRRLLSRVAIRVRMAVFCGLGVAVRANDGAGDFAARVALARRDAIGAFELLDNLLAVGALQVPERSSDPANHIRHSILNGNGSGGASGDGYEGENGKGSVARGTNGPPTTLVLKGESSELSGESPGTRRHEPQSA
jgi:hypothetical protein